MIGDLDLSAWLEGTREREWPAADGQELVVGDLEVQYIVDSVAGVPRLAVRERGAIRGLATFSDTESALRLLVILLGRGWRFSHRMERVRPSLPETVSLEETPLGVHLEWATGWADLPSLRAEPSLPALLAAAVDAPLSLIAASIRDPAGAPLFAG